MDDNAGSVTSQLISYGIEIGFLISGFFGALMMVSKNASQKIGTTVASLLAGTACANYLTPVIMNFVPEKIHGQGKYAVAFMMGFMGLKGLEMVIEKYLKSNAQKGGVPPIAARQARKNGGNRKKGKKK